MKLTATLALALALSISTLAIAQSGGMKGMDMKDMDMGGSSGKTVTHQTNAVVKDVDVSNGKVTLAHEPVKSLDWPAMTMGFSVKDKMLFDKLVPGKKVKVEFVQQGPDYIVTAVK